MPDTGRDPREAIGQTQYRTMEIRADASAVDTEARTVELAFSSSEPVERGWGSEILDHGQGAVRLHRIRDGGALLLEHDRNRQIGVVETATIGKDEFGRAKVRFSRGPLGEEIMGDIADGIRSKVSVGYIVHDMLLEKSDDGGKTYRVTDWEPIEISIVSIPADTNVGVGRNQPEHVMPDAINPAGDTPATKTETETSTTDIETSTTETGDTDARDFDNADAAQIRAVGRHFHMLDEAESHIALGGNLKEFRDLVRQRQPEPVPADPVPVTRIESRIPHGGRLRAFTPEIHGTRQAGEEAAYRSGQFYRANLFGDTRAARWCRDHGINLSTRTLDGVGAGQAALIPDELSATLISLKEQYGLASSVCDVVPMSSDSRTVAIDTDEVVAEWVGAGEAATADDTGFGYITLNAKRLRAKTVIDNDYADDSVIDLADHVAQKQARAFAIAEDRALFLGDGTSTYGGIVGIVVKIIGTAGAIDAASGIDTLAEITAADLRKLPAALLDVPGLSPSWYCSKVAQELVFGRLADAAGGNTKRDLATGEQQQWGGYGIRRTPVLTKSTGDLSNLPILVFGDLEMGVKFGQRKQMEMMVNPYALMDQGQTQILSFERIDINVHGVGDSTAAGVIGVLFGE